MFRGRDNTLPVDFFFEHMVEASLADLIEVSGRHHKTFGQESIWSMSVRHLGAIFRAFHRGLALLAELTKQTPRPVRVWKVFVLVLASFSRVKMRERQDEPLAQTVETATCPAARLPKQAERERDLVGHQWEEGGEGGEE
eukprot:753673-Hanusia_phi.AAC.2